MRCIFKEISQKILSAVNSNNRKICLTLMPTYSRTDSSYDSSEIPVGYNFEDKINANRLHIDDISSIRFKGDEYHVLKKDEIPCYIDAVYLPLISILLSKWIYSIENNKKYAKKIIVLVSGRGYRINCYDIYYIYHCNLQ